MASKTSSALFWAKHLGLALALIIMAAVVISLQNNRASAPKPEGVKQKKTVSQGMTDFYAAHRLSSSKPFQEDLGDFVMEFNKEDEPLTSRLRKMESLQKPVSSNWVGEHKYRSFKAGNTLREAITSYAQNEGMQVIWELDKDFIIKHHFQMQNTVIGAFGQIANAVDASFDGDVLAYMCPKQRSLVITNKDSNYLRKHCALVKR